MKVLERAAGHASGPYHVPAIDVESIAVRTNNPVCGAFRGFGANQAQFAMEGVLDRLAEQVGISRLGDPQAQRDPRPAQVWGPGQIMDDGCRRRRGAASTRSSPHYDAAVAAGKAVGLGLGPEELAASATASRRSSAPSCASRATARVEVRHGWTEMGQGVHTVALQVAVEELGIDPDRIQVDRRHHPRARRRPDHRQPRHADGRRLGADGVPGGAGRRLPAGRRLRGRVPRRLDPQARRAGRRAPDDPLGLRLRRAAGRRSTARRGAIERVVAAHDVGRAVNPLLCEGQIEGTVHMGLGYALTEDFPADPRPASRRT